MKKQTEKNNGINFGKKMQQWFVSFQHTGHAEQLNLFRIQVKKASKKGENVFMYAAFIQLTMPVEFE